MKSNIDRNIYFFIIPAVIFTVIFNYLPMIGISMAFENYDLFAGSGPISALFASDWVGLDNFRIIFSDPKFWSVFQNTIEISFLKILFIFPLPIICALMINEVVRVRAKKIIQTIIYMPHFLSWVIIAGVWLTIFGGGGMINNILRNMDIISKPIPFLTTGFLFRVILILSDAWKEIGWSAIIYLAAITSIDYQLYEAIKIDGGNKLHEILYVTIPGIFPTIVMMFILRMSSVMDAGFDQIFNMYSPYVYDSADVISTYVYRLGLGSMEYSQATAIGLFNSVIAFTLVVSANKLSRHLTNRGIW